MKVCTIIMMCFLAFLLVGCSETTEKKLDMHLINSELINSYNDIALENAIITQHTLFPYHFVNNAAELNELGQRDMGVLTKNFLKNPGKLNIRRNDCSMELYRARVKFVLDVLKDAGIDAEQIRISDGMPGGAGMPSQQVLLILEDADKTPSITTSTTD
ncbi:MAG: hypothetical protein ACYS0I_11310 [Planctomycetota bacterium]